MKTLIAALVVLVGCGYPADWVPDLSDGPVTLDISPKLTLDQIRAVQLGVVALNKAFEADVIVLSANDGKAGKNQIGLSDKNGFDESQLVGQAIFYPDRCLIELTSRPEIVKDVEVMKLVVMHELLHCLGYDHVEDPTDVMHQCSYKGQTIKPYLIEDVNARLRGE